jgi:hypothetical protein
LPTATHQAAVQFSVVDYWVVVTGNTMFADIIQRLVKSRGYKKMEKKGDIQSDPFQLNYTCENWAISQEIRTMCQAPSLRALKVLGQAACQV